MGCGCKKNKGKPDKKNLSERNQKVKDALKRLMEIKKKDSQTKRKSGR
jgi:hypothetical protein|tara:strand:- start:570 stop:713 length:144 start_codon:yes stop_codon:yes gene_type:complete